jgi:hypothetical protein
MICRMRVLTWWAIGLSSFVEDSFFFLGSSVEFDTVERAQMQDYCL